MRRINLRGGTVEVQAIVEAAAAAARPPHVRLVHQRRRLQRVDPDVFGHVVLGESAQFAVHLRHQLGQRIAIAAAPPGEQFGDIPHDRPHSSRWQCG